MGALTRSEVEAIAALAQLELDSDEVERLRTDLGAILAHFETLAAVDTDGVPAMTHAVDIELRLRADDRAEGLAPALAIGAANQHGEEFFRVPPIIAPDPESEE